MPRANPLGNTNPELFPTYQWPHLLWRRSTAEDDGQEHSVRVEVVERPQEAGAMRSS